MKAKALFKTMLLIVVASTIAIGRAAPLVEDGVLYLKDQEVEFVAKTGATTTYHFGNIPNLEVTSQNIEISILNGKKTEKRTAFLISSDKIGFSVSTDHPYPLSRKTEDGKVAWIIPPQ
jgi:hypothetical protein